MIAASGACLEQGPGLRRGPVAAAGERVSRRDGAPPTAAIDHATESAGKHPGFGIVLATAGHRLARLMRRIVVQPARARQPAGSK